MSLKGLLWLISTGKMPAVPAPSGNEGGGGYLRGRAPGRLCVVIRGVVSDAVPCLLTGVICDLPFNVVGLPKKMGGMIAHPSMICQSPRAAFLQKFPHQIHRVPAYDFMKKGSQSVPGHTRNRYPGIPTIGWHVSLEEKPT